MKYILILFVLLWSMGVKGQTYTADTLYWIDGKWLKITGLRGPLLMAKDTIIYSETSVRYNISCYHKKRRKHLVCKYN